MIVQMTHNLFSKKISCGENHRTSSFYRGLWDLLRNELITKQEL